MKKLIFTCFVSCIGLNLSAQSFINEIDLGNEKEITDVIVLPATHEYVLNLAVGDSMDDFFPKYLHSSFLLLDSIGKVKKSNTLNDFYPIELIKRSNSFLVYGYFSVNGMHEGMAIYALDYQLKVLDSMKITSHFPVLTVQIDVNSRGEIIIPVTESDTLRGIFYSSILKLDSNFQIIDTLVYDTISYAAIAGMVNSRDESIVYQLNVDYRQMTKEFKDYVFLIDRAGDKIGKGSPIMPVYNSISDSLKIYDGIALRELPNQNVVLSGRVQNPQTYVPQNPNSGDDYGIIVYDNYLRYIQHEVIGSVDTGDYPATRNIAYDDKYFYIAGVTQWTASDYYRDINNKVRINQFDFQGNLMNTWNYDVGNYVRINSIKSTYDKGLVIVGSNYDQYGNSGGLNGFIMKVDSLGNLVTGIANLKNKSLLDSKYYKVYPNPAKDKLNLLKINQFEPYDLELYDTFGRLVKAVKWSESHQQINVADLVSGMYVYRIIDKEGRTGSGKIMVE